MSNIQDSEPKKVENPRLKEIKFTLKKIKGSPLSLFGLGLVIFFVAVSCLAPVLAPPKGYDPFLIPTSGSYGREPKPPSPDHLFGTTTWQTDIYYGCIWGTIHAFRMGIFVEVVTVIVGVILGLASAYYGGIIDEIVMRFTDIILAFPGLILIMALVVALSRSALPFSMTGNNRLDASIVGIILIGWPGYTRLIRGEVLRVKSEDYVEAARASGASDFRIILKHIIPNAIYPVIIVASLGFGSIVLTTASLSFLGLGAPVGFADWGQLIYSSVDWISSGFRYWWTFIIPGAFIILFVLGWNLLGDAMRDVLDPLYRRK
jgi:peptide/nickel transport system permease protein